MSTSDHDELQLVDSQRRNKELEAVIVQQAAQLAERSEQIAALEAVIAGGAPPTTPRSTAFAAPLRAALAADQLQFIVVRSGHGRTADLSALEKCPMGQIESQGPLDSV